MRDDLQYGVRCDCGADILLPLEVLSQWFASRRGQAKDIEPIAVVCNRCKRVRNYDFARKRQNPPRVPLLSLPKSAEWAYLGWLLCEDKTCEARLPMFARMNSAVSPEDRERESLDWIWEGLRCPAGKPIPKPV